MSMMPNSVQMDTPIGTPHTNSCPSSGPPSSPPTPLPQRAAAVPSETVFIHPLSPDMETTGLPGDLNQVKENVNLNMEKCFSLYIILKTVFYVSVLCLYGYLFTDVIVFSCSRLFDASSS